MEKMLYKAVVRLGRAEGNLGYTDNKAEFLMYAENLGIQPENIRFIPAPEILKEYN